MHQLNTSINMLNNEMDIEPEIKILVDMSRINSLTTGISIYAFRILDGFRDNGINNITLLLSTKNVAMISSIYPGFNYILVSFCIGRYRRLKNMLLNPSILKRVINNSDCDVYFSPDYKFFNFRKLRKKHVQTIHDLLALRVYKGVEYCQYRFGIPMILKNCDSIISISDFVRNDVLNIYPNIPESKIKTIYNSVVLKAAESSFSINYSYILYVGTLIDYKNVLTLMKAFALLHTEITHKLVVIGATTKFWQETVIPFIESNGIQNKVVHIELVSDEELTAYYQNASLFVTTSLHEGFGYTPIEAAMCNVPVISTKETALYETTMGLLNYYEPATDVSALRTKIIEVLNNPPKIDSLKNIADQYRKRYDYKIQSMKVYDFIQATFRN